MADKRMQVKQSIEMFGHRFTIWQGDGRAVILQVDNVYLAGDADELGDLVIPHQMLVTDNFQAAQEICAAVDASDSSVALAAAYLHRTRRMA